jgi:hypothetical protein
LRVFSAQVLMWCVVRSGWGKGGLLSFRRIKFAIVGDVDEIVLRSPGRVTGILDLAVQVKFPSSAFSFCQSFPWLLLQVPSSVILPPFPTPIPRVTAVAISALILLTSSARSQFWCFVNVDDKMGSPNATVSEH